jgi:hypothetical protein
MADVKTIEVSEILESSRLGGVVVTVVAIGYQG